MFRFNDGTCGFTIPHAAGTGAVFLTALGGDYALDSNPLAGPARTVNAFKLEALANRRKTYGSYRRGISRLTRARGSSLRQLV
jgi:hypothetical protein